jgi:hypothetical protein
MRGVVSTNWTHRCATLFCGTGISMFIIIMMVSRTCLTAEKVVEDRCKRSPAGGLVVVPIRSIKIE